MPPRISSARLTAPLALLLAGLVAACADPADNLLPGPDALQGDAGTDSEHADLDEADADLGGDVEVSGDVGGAPTISIASPANDTRFDVADTVVVRVTVHDSDDGAADLQVDITSDLDGTLWSGRPAAGGSVVAQLSGLSAGLHTLTVAVTDSQALEATADVAITLEGNAPVVVVGSPPNDRRRPRHYRRRSPNPRPSTGTPSTTPGLTAQAPPPKARRSPQNRPRAATPGASWSRSRTKRGPSGERPQR